MQKRGKEHDVTTYPVRKIRVVDRKSGHVFGDRCRNITRGAVTFLRDDLTGKISAAHGVYDRHAANRDASQLVILPPL